MQNPSSQGSRLNGTSSYLSYAPIQYSLTDGTSIPPPAPAAMKENSLSPFSAAKADGSSSLGGPLSSHPVTPIESPSAERDPNVFPDSYNWSRPAAPPHMSSNGDHPVQQQQQQQGPANGASHHASHASNDSNNFDPAPLYHQPSRDTSRRPSFVERFLPRLRSASFMRSRSSLGKFGDSSSSLAQQQAQPGSSGTPTGNGSTVAEQGRGLKRAGSPALDRPESRGSTFPRMMRKKSMDLLSTARRRSGMWGRENGSGTAASAMAEERERERRREVELEEEEENRKRVQAIRRELDRQPPPKLPEFDAIGSATGGGSLADEDLFKNIGR